MKKLLILAMAISTWLVPSAMAQTSIFTDRALQQVNVLTSPTPLTAAIPYGSVRVCGLPLTQASPCLPLATITDINGNPVSNAIGPAFGQLTTDATGRYTFGCTNNVTYQVQVAASASNTPAVNYPVTCPGGVGASVSANNAFSGSNTFSKINKGCYVDGVTNTTISAAITACGSTGAVYIPCGTYSDNVTITAPINIFGAGENCVTVNPANTANPVFDINATNVTSIDTLTLAGMTIQCPAATSCAGDGIRVTGKQNINQVNDHISFEHLIIGLQLQNTTGANGFNHNIEFSGRSVWSTMYRVRSYGARGDDLHIALTGGTVGPVSALWINQSEFRYAFGYGVFMNVTGATVLPAANSFQNTNIEYNGNNTALSPCAGTYINGEGQVEFSNVSWEGNCPSSTDTNNAQLRITGTVNYSISVHGGSMIVGAPGAPKYGIFNDATGPTTGSYDGIHFLGSYTKAIHIATTHNQSNVHVGTNFGGSVPEIILDACANSHVSSVDPFILPEWRVNSGCLPIGAGTSFDLAALGPNQPMSSIQFTNGPKTVSNITGAALGQYLWLSVAAGSAFTLTNAAGGAGQITFNGGTNRVLNAGDAVLLRSDDGSTWNEVFPGKTPPFASGTLLPSAAGGTDIGSTALPFGNLWLGTAATNNFKFQPGATTGARIITVTDPVTPTTVGLPLLIASGTSTLNSGALATNTCQATVTTAATGVTTTDAIEWSFATVPASADGLTTISAAPTANNVNFVRCNASSASQTTTAIVINWRVIR